MTPSIKLSVLRAITSSALFSMNFVLSPAGAHADGGTCQNPRFGEVCNLCFGNGWVGGCCEPAGYNQCGYAGCISTHDAGCYISYYCCYSC